MPITAEKAAVGGNKAEARAAKGVGRLLRKHATKGIYLSRLGEGRSTINISIRFLGGNVEITALDEFMWIDRTDRSTSYQLRCKELPDLLYHRLPEPFAYQPLFGMMDGDKRQKARSTRALLDNLAMMIADNPKRFGLLAVTPD